MLEYVGYVNQGLHHETNDDAALLKRSVITDGFFMGKSKENSGIFAVADGVGSVFKSELASRYVLSELREHNANRIEGIKQSISDANKGLLNLTEQLNLPQILCTTLCAVSIIDSKVVAFNVGNSRLYRFRNGILKLLTKDHTKVQEYIDAGKWEEDRAKEHPESHLITHSIGNIDFELKWIDVKEYENYFGENDFLMLCSDGIHEYVPRAFIEEVMSLEIALSEMATLIVQYALDMGGYDNASVVLIRKMRD